MTAFLRMDDRFFHRCPANTVLNGLQGSESGGSQPLGCILEISRLAGVFGDSLNTSGGFLLVANLLFRKGKPMALNPKGRTSIGPGGSTAEKCGSVCEMVFIGKRNGELACVRIK